MKKYILVLFILGFCLSSCDKDIYKFDDSTNYIYFDIPNKLNVYGKPVSGDIRVDSIVHSFGIEGPEVTSHTFDIIVNTVGLPAGADREYRVALHDDTNFDKSDWNISVINDRTVKAEAMSDVIQITVQRTDILKTEWKHIVLELKPNDYFALGDSRLHKVVMSFSNILAQPSWWNTWKSRLGEFHREVYLKWTEIYYEGADTKKDSEGYVYYWGNMPPNAVESWYPTTFKYMRVLKKYFLENEVYPDGDTSKPRITLPD